MFRATLLLWLLVAASPAFCSTWEIDFGSLGPIHIGMTPKAIHAAGGGEHAKDNTALKHVQTVGCDGINLTDVYLQFDGGRLDEIVTGSKRFRMSNGTGVGSRYADIVRVFGTDRKRVAIGANIYDDNVPQVTVEAPPEIRRQFGGRRVSIQFEFEPGPLTARSRIARISIGQHWAEGCA